MLDWLGALHQKERNPGRVVFEIRPATRWVGWVAILLGIVGWWEAGRLGGILWLAPAGLVFAGVAMASIRRQIEVSRADGVVRIEQSVLGFPTRTQFPLFHIRAIVVNRALTGRRTRYVAYIDRRIGGAIFLDEATRSRALTPMAEAIAEIAEVRLEFDLAE